MRVRRSTGRQHFGASSSGAFALVLRARALCELVARAHLPDVDSRTERATIWLRASFGSRNQTGRRNTRARPLASGLNSAPVESESGCELRVASCAQGKPQNAKTNSASVNSVCARVRLRAQLVAVRALCEPVCDLRASKFRPLQLLLRTRIAVARPSESDQNWHCIRRASASAIAIVTATTTTATTTTTTAATESSPDESHGSDAARAEAALAHDLVSVRSLQKCCQCD